MGVFAVSCRIAELRHKEVINQSDGMRLGFVDDVEIDTRNACLVSVVIYGRPRLFGLLGRCEDVVIPWGNISLIGEDTILVSCGAPRPPRKKKRFI